MSVQALLKKVRDGDRRALAKAVTLVESSDPHERQDAHTLIKEILPTAGKSIRIAISGAPGVGKSTFIEAFGRMLIQQGHRIAVLAIDPSSPISGGSIMGDKTRMEWLSAHEAAFVRPSPSSGSLGGIARRTREAALLTEAAGFDIILIETVGVGQSEYEAAMMSDVFVLLHLPHSGDDLQGIKRGILELADIVAVTKSDGDLLQPSEVAKSQIEGALRYARSGGDSWHPPVVLTSAIKSTGIETLWNEIRRFLSISRTSGQFQLRRDRQLKHWVCAEMLESIRVEFNENPSWEKTIDQSVESIRSGKQRPPSVAQSLIKRSGKVII